MQNYGFKFITTDSPYYEQAVELRFQEFYAPYGLTKAAAQDEFESSSRHLVCVKDDSVIGYVRLTIIENVGVITQYVIRENERGQVYMAQNLIKILIQDLKESGIKKVTGIIKLNVTKSARRMGFAVDDAVIYSKKTGLPHKRIEMLLS